MVTFFLKFSRRELARDLSHERRKVVGEEGSERGVTPGRRRGAIITREVVGLEFADRAHNSDSLNGTVEQRDRVSQRPAESCRSLRLSQVPFRSVRVTCPTSGTSTRSTTATIPAAALFA